MCSLFACRGNRSRVGPFNPCYGSSSKARILLSGNYMSLVAKLAPHLPYVRRYARALTGDQVSGDNYVRAALEAVAAGEVQLKESVTPRVALYQVFHAIWGTTGAQLEMEAANTGDDPSRRLLRIPPRSRQAFRR